MRVLITVATALLVGSPSLAQAKRIPAPKVPPVVYQGVRYVAPNDKGRRAYIQAWDAKTNLVWSVIVFRNFINPFLEEDVQWVYIKSLSVRDGALVATDERGRAFSVDLKTRAVRKLPKPMVEGPKVNQAPGNAGSSGVFGASGPV